MFTLLDRYLLGDAVSKKAVLTDVLAHRSDVPATAPFYRALDAVGARAADEAFMALRLAAVGLEPSDERVRRIRALVAVARAAAVSDRSGVERAIARDAVVLSDLPPLGIPGSTLDGIATAARVAYRREIG